MWYNVVNRTEKLFLEKKMKIGIDLDFTINWNKNTISFFSMLTHALKEKAEIFIITNRGEYNRDMTIKELDALKIYYDHLIITDKKADFIINEGITIFFDDTDEYFLTLPDTVCVFKIREPGNFDFEDHKWLYGKQTGKLI